MDLVPDIAPFQRRLDECNAQMAEPSFYANPRRAAEVTREQQKLARLVADHAALAKLDRELAEAQALARDPAGDAALKELAAQELPVLAQRAAALREAVLLAMIPPEPTDSRNTVMEIRAGTGGEEAALFAGELARMYQKYAEACGWKIEPMGSSVSERGGFREVSFLVSGQEVYRRLKFESGVHRVQRVPVTEASGRIHTSTVTVAVLPEAEEVDVQIDPQELEITVQRASGPGGQGVNTTDSAVRITHLPTGIVVACQNERSQLQNKTTAMGILKARLAELERRRRQEELDELRGERKAVDFGSQIRSYVLAPYQMVKDHRTNEEVGDPSRVLDGDLDRFIEAELRRRASAGAG